MTRVVAHTAEEEDVHAPALHRHITDLQNELLNQVQTPEPYKCAATKAKGEMKDSTMTITMAATMTQFFWKRMAILS